MPGRVRVGAVDPPGHVAHVEITLELPLGTVAELTVEALASDGGGGEPIVEAHAAYEQADGSVVSAPIEIRVTRG
jgi:hypothetical protein